MIKAQELPRESAGLSSYDLTEDAFSRIDESDDTLFYATDRFVQHLDSLALSTVERLIGELVVEESPVILDLMAGWDSHIPQGLEASKVVGLGLNQNELSRNKALTEIVIHDLNKTPKLPFPDAVFDVVLNTVSVDYMTKPVDVFREIGRILKPNGLLLVVFSNRMFPQKVTRVWSRSSERERVMLVEDFFRSAEIFEAPKGFVSRGRPRPKDDKYARHGIPSDPIYAVYADKKGPESSRKVRPDVSLSDAHVSSPEEIERRMREVGNTMLCPHCGKRLNKWAVPNTPFTTWDTEFMYICFNDACPYLLRGWETMNRQGNRGISYRLMYDASRDKCMPVPVPSLDALKDGIVE